MQQAFRKRFDLIMGTFKGKGGRAGKAKGAKKSKAAKAASPLSTTMVSAAESADAAQDSLYGRVTGGHLAASPPPADAPIPEVDLDLSDSESDESLLIKPPFHTRGPLSMRGVNKNGRPTCDGGLQIEWYAELDDGKKLEFKSVRTLVIGLVAEGVPLKGFEAVRTFLQRRTQAGSRAQSSSYEQFEGVVSIRRYGSIRNLLSGKPGAIARSQARKELVAARHEAALAYAATMAATACEYTALDDDLDLEPSAPSDSGALADMP